MKKLLYKNEVFEIVGAAINVHKELGPGFLEAVYQEALEIEFEDSNMPYISQPEIGIYFKKRKLKKYYQPDFLVQDEIVIEIKAIKVLGNIEEAQLINALKCCNKKLGLLINFGETSLKWKRYIYNTN